MTFVLGTAIFIFRQKLNCTICKISRIFVLSISSLIFLLVQNDPLTIEKRFFLIKNSIEIVSKHALIGVGLGSYVVAQHTIPMKFLDQLVFDTTRTVGLLLLTGIAAIVGLTVYTVLSWLLKIKEVEIFYQFCKKVLFFPIKLTTPAPTSIEAQEPNP